MGGGKIYDLIGQITNHGIMTAAVPLFFFMSGYLYFIATGTEGEFGLVTWKSKTWNRVKSLVVPYVIWNLLIVAMFAVMQSLTRGSETMAREGYKMVADYGLVDYLKALWAIDSTGMPMDGPLWFVRNLIIISIVFTWPIYWWVRHTKIYGLLLLLALHLSGVYNLPGGMVSSVLGCLFCFAWGGYCALTGRMLLTSVSHRTLHLFGVAIVVTLLIHIVSDCYYDSNIWGVNNLYIFTTILLVFGWLAPYARAGKLRVWSILPASSFFIYAMHKPVQVIIRRFSFAWFDPNTEVVLTAMCLLVPLMVILICLGTFYIVRRYMPCLKALNGFRW